MSTPRTDGRKAATAKTTGSGKGAGGKVAATKAQQRRERAAQAARAAAQARQRRRRLLIAGGAGAAVLVAAAVVLVVLLTGGSHTRSAQAPPTPTQQGAAPASAPAAGPPSWPAPAADKVAAAVRAAGLPLLTMEGTDQHFHAHLDVIVDGRAVPVPAGIGIAGNTGVSSMHTHDPGGVIHIESPAKGTFTLGQFFTEWQVPLTGSGTGVCVGQVCPSGDRTWKVYLNGQPYTGDPATLVLAAHQEIAMVYGTLPAGTSPPDHYDFPAGL